MTLKFDKDEKESSDSDSVGSLKLIKSPKIYPGSSLNLLKPINDSSNMSIPNPLS